MTLADRRAVRDRCIRCPRTIRVPADAVPPITVMARDGSKVRGWHCRLCKEHLQHVSTCKRAMHVERWP